MIAAAHGPSCFASKAHQHAVQNFILRPPCTSKRVECKNQSSRDNNIPTVAPATPYPDANVQHWGLPWDYKYTRVSCSSPCSSDDMRCLKVEALFQNVLMYPRLPSRVAAWLPAVDASIEQITETVEALADKFGAELGFYIIRRQPAVLNHNFQTLMERAENLRSMLDLKPIELYAVLRKNPMILLIDPAETRARYNGIHKVVHFSRDAVRTMVRKMPVLLNWETSNLERRVDDMRQLAYTRVQWQEEFDCISPSLLAFFFRDSIDLILRMEYLVASRAAPDASLKDLFKMTNSGFARKHPDFRAWRTVRLQKKQEKRARLERQKMLAQQEQEQRQQALMAHQSYMMQQQQQEQQQHEDQRQGMHQHQPQHQPRQEQQLQDLQQQQQQQQQQQRQRQPQLQQGRLQSGKQKHAQRQRHS